MSERENAYTHFRDTGEFLSGQAMSDMNQKAEEIANSEAIKLLAKINPDILTVDSIALTTKTLLQFAEQYAQEKNRELVETFKQVLSLEYEEARMRKEYPAGTCISEDAWRDFGKHEEAVKAKAAELLTQHSGKGGK
jgi:hypothetical protein